MIDASQKKTRIQIFSLLLVFALPAMIAWYLFHFHEQFQFKTVNYGVLVNPPITVQDLSAGERKWQIVYATSACSDKQSEKMMYTLHQVQKALGKDRDRVNLTLVANETCQLKDAHDFRKVLLTHQQYTQWQKQFSRKGEKNFVVNNKIYLVDPANNLFMFYPVTTNPMGILKDIKHILGVSQIG